MPSIKGTSSIADSRSLNKALKSTKFPKNFADKLDLTKINRIILTQWIENRVTQSLGFEDEIVQSTAVNLFLPTSPEDSNIVPTVDPKKAQIDLSGFLGEEEAAAFSKELWDLMLNAQESPMGIPRKLLEEKKRELAEQQEQQQQPPALQGTSQDHRSHLNQGRAERSRFEQSNDGGAAHPSANASQESRNHNRERDSHSGMRSRDRSARHDYSNHADRDRGQGRSSSGGGGYDEFGRRRADDRRGDRREEYRRDDGDRDSRRDRSRDRGRDYRREDHGRRYDREGGRYREYDDRVRRGRYGGDDRVPDRYVDGRSHYHRERRTSGGDRDSYHHRQRREERSRSRDRPIRRRDRPTRSRSPSSSSSSSSSGSSRSRS